MDPWRLRDLLAPELADGPRTAGLHAALRALVLDGRLLPGTKLPSERVLADVLRLSRSTVTAAYDELRGEGYLVSRRGAGTFAELPASATAARPDDDETAAGERLLDLTVAALPAPSYLAVAALDAARELGKYLGGNGLEPTGITELRTAVARRYGERGLPTRPEEILVTSGALHGWDLLLRAYAGPGASIVAEQPTYPGVLDAALAHRVRIHPLPVEPSGWDLSALRGIPFPVLAHLVLDGQNPTGAWASNTTRRRVLAAFDSSTLVVVDETMAELPHGDPGTAPAPALARRGANVVAVGSASKAFWAGLRVGWLRAPTSVIRRVAAVRAGQDLAPPILDQLVTARLLERAAELLAERRALLAERRVALLDALARHCPDWSVTPPGGGLALWVDLGGGSSTRLARLAREQGLRITPGPRFTLRGSHDRWLRLPLVLPPEQVDDVVRRLALAAAGLEPARSRRRPAAEAAWTA